MLKNRNFSEGRTFLIGREGFTMEIPIQIRGKHSNYVDISGNICQPPLKLIFFCIDRTDFQNSGRYGKGNSCSLHFWAANIQNIWGNVAEFSWSFIFAMVVQYRSLGDPGPASRPCLELHFIVCCRKLSQ